MTTKAFARKSLAKPVAKPTPKSEIKTSWAGRVPHIKPGRYADGMPLDEIEYLACKLVLRPNRFGSRKNLFDFAKVLQAPADQCGVGFSTEEFENAPPKSVKSSSSIPKTSGSTTTHSSCASSYSYTDGFPSGEPEIVFKFRHPDIQKAAEADVPHRFLETIGVKFKCQALPLKDRLGGIRMLFSHNVQFPRSHVGRKPIRIYFNSRRCENLPGAGSPKEVTGRKI